MTTPISSVWNQSMRMANRHSGSGNNLFVRLANHGDKVVGTFCGDPLPREVIWTGTRYETYKPENHGEQKPSFRVMLNFYVPDEQSMKVIEGGVVWFKDVLKVRDKYGLDNWFFEIERHGEAGDPKTTYTILPETKITAEQKELIAQTRLHDLAGLVGENSDDGIDPPINEQTAIEIITLLKELPRNEVDTFLNRFRVGRVRDMRESDVDTALQLLGGLHTNARWQENQPNALVDPFA